MFSVSKYLSRIEEASLEILENLEPINGAITLWWGLDGLRLNEDGTTEWVSRRKKPVETVLYQPCQSVMPIQAEHQQARWTDQTQSTRAQIEALMARNAALATQCLADARSAYMANALQQCCVQYTAQYPPYYYGGFF